MKIISTFAFILIAGILRSVHADHADAQLLCKNGGRDGYDEIIRSSSNQIEACYQSKINEWMEEVETSKSKKYSVIFALLCNKIDTLSYCVKRFTDIIESCAALQQHDDVRDDVLVLYNIKPLILQFACANREIINEGLNNPDQYCFASKLQAVKNCIFKFLIGKNATVPEIPKHQSDLIDMLSQFENGSDGQDCSGVQNFEQCSVEVADECEDEIFVKILDSMSNYINNKTSCKSLLESPRSGASPELNDTLGRECFNSFSQQFTHCTGHSMQNVTNYLMSKSTATTSDFDLGECKVIEKLKYCFSTSLQNCKYYRPVQVMSSLFQIVGNHSSCKKLLQSKPSSAVILSVSLLDTLSLTIMGIAMFLRFT